MRRRARGAAIIEVLIVVAFSVGLGLLAMMLLATTADVQATEESTCIATLSCEARSNQTGGSLSGITTGTAPPERYGDDRTGKLGALEDFLDPQPPIAARPLILAAVDNGDLQPDPSSRLGAYAATKGFAPGTVGYAVHKAIALFYIALGSFGQERVGTLFNSAEAQALFSQSVDGPASLQFATLEYNYWKHVKDEDPDSPGGNLGAAVDPATRDFGQKVLGHL